MRRSALILFFLPLLAAAQSLLAPSFSRCIRFVTAPGTARIVFQYSGNNALSIDAEGNLDIAASREVIVQEPPVALQHIGGSLRLVSTEYLLGRNGQVIVLLGPCDRSRPVEIQATIPARLSSMPSVQADGRLVAE